MATLTITIEIADTIADNYRLEKWRRSHGAARGDVLSRMADGNRASVTGHAQTKSKQIVLNALADAIIAAEA